MNSGTFSSKVALPFTSTENDFKRNTNIVIYDDDARSINPLSEDLSPATHKHQYEDVD